MIATVADATPSTTRPPASRRRRPFPVATVARWVGIVVVVFVFLAPLVWMLLASLKTNVDIYDPSKAFAFTPTLENYETVFAQSDFGRFVWNSFFVSAVATGLSLVLAVPAAYSMSRFLMKKSSMAVLLARIIPGVSLLVPWYMVFAQLQLVGTYTVLVLSMMFVAMPLILYIMMSYFDSMPEELEESAQVDGLTAIGAFLRVTLPLSLPGVATASILAFIFAWNNFMFALVLSGRDTKTLPVAIFDFVGYASIDWGGLMAAATVVTIPIMLIALFTQRFIVSGLTAGATKG